ncbi:MAG: nitroreductase [Anaerocolumna sp.]|nr:nitroreductase [Anaerocolumna sp.]
MSITKQDILNAYQFRHACKMFDDTKKITEEDFNFILETGRLSPSSFGFEPWKFIIIQNEKIRESLRTVTWGAQKQLPTASHYVVILSRKSDIVYDSEYVKHIMKDVQELPKEVAAGKRDAFENFQKSDFHLLDTERNLADWASKQTYIALGNMMTSAALIGIDSCPIEGYDKEKAEEILAKEGLLDRSKFDLSVMVAFGYRVNDPRPKTRQNIEDLTDWIM